MSFPNDMEIAWMAGLFEGDGSFSVSLSGPTRSVARMYISMLDRDVVEKVCDLLGTNLSNYTIVRGGKEKKMWQTSLARKEDLNHLLPRFYPFMGGRRQAQIDKLLNKIGGVS